MVENIILDLSKEHRHDFHVVRLNGFIHTDDKLALKDIWRQLGKEMEVEDDLLHRVSIPRETWDKIRPVKTNVERDADKLRRYHGFSPRLVISPVGNHGHG